MPDLRSVFCAGKFCFEYSYMLLVIIPVVIALYFFVNRSFIKFFSRSEQQAYEKDRVRQRLIFFIIRGMILSLVLIAIASPFIMESRTVQGNPRITILVDNSTSMNLYESGMGQELADKLKGKVPVTLRTIAVGDKSSIGDGILNNIERDENVLVVTDGNNNDGKLLGDIMILASSLNVTVSTLAMDPLRGDAGVSIEGPSEAIRDTEEVFMVNVNAVGNVPYNLEVRFDNEIVLAQSGAESRSFAIRKNLDEGYHRMTAQLSGTDGDYFSQNNIYYKSIKVVQRPKVLFVSSKSSPLAGELAGIYDLTTVSSIPSELEDYLAVILNDLPMQSVAPYADELSDYVSDGNGLFVIGGQNSYDRGGYKGTLFETLLPAKTGAGEESEKSDVQIVVIIDVSGTTGKVYNVNTGQYEIRDYDEVIKAQAASVIGSLDEKNNAGVIVVGTRNPTGTVVTLSEIESLKGNKDKVIDLISRISRDKVGGQTDIKMGIDKANQMLRSVSGSKNIVLLSDGRGLTPLAKNQVIDSTKGAAGKGIKVYVAGIGAVDDQDNQFLSDITTFGDGVYFPADASSRLRILFGEPEDSDEKEFLNSLVLLDTTHFITYNQSIDAVINGYNYVIPKPASRLLVTTNKNIPVMVVWRFGLGRVVTFASDDGGGWAGEMLRGDNSKLLTKAINWAIGDLSRKKSFDVSIKDTELGKPMFVNMVSGTVPQHEKLKFAKTDVNTYTANFYPEKAGFESFFGADAAVNYKDEYKDLGVSSEFIGLVEQTQGKVFDRNDIDAILEFIKEKSKRLKVDTTELKWPFLIAALLLFLAEITLRRMWENKGSV